MRKVALFMWLALLLAPAANAKPYICSPLPPDNALARNPQARDGTAEDCKLSAPKPGEVCKCFAVRETIYPLFGVIGTAIKYFTGARDRVITDK